MKERIINFPELKFTFYPQIQIPVYLKSAKNDSGWLYFRYDDTFVKPRNGKLTVWSATLPITRGAYFPVMVIAPLFRFSVTGYF